MVDRALFMVLFAVACGVLGCKPIARLFEPQAATMMPEDFASNPLLRPLAEAVDRGDVGAITAAVEAGADVNAFGKGGYRLLYWAMARGKVEGFQELLKHGAPLDDDYRDSSYLRDPSYNRTVLEKVIEDKDQRFLKAALRQGLDPDHAPHEIEKRSLLFFAVSSHSHPAIETLLAAGANINWQNYSGYTPLVDARMGRDYNAAWLLLRHGADPTVKDKLGHDFVWGLREYGSRGVRPDHRKSFELIVEELVKRGLLTHQDIVDADKPKTPNSGITVIEHSPDSEAGQAILELDRREREAGK